jgi:hypothetical protein
LLVEIKEDRIHHLDAEAGAPPFWKKKTELRANAPWIQTEWQLILLKQVMFYYSKTNLIFLNPRDV